MFQSIFSTRKSSPTRPTAQVQVERLEGRDMPSTLPMPIALSRGEDWPPPPATQSHVSRLTVASHVGAPHDSIIIGEEIPTLTSSDHVVKWANRNSGDEIPMFVVGGNLLANTVEVRHIGEEIPQ